MNVPIRSPRLQTVVAVAIAMLAMSACGGDSTANADVTVDQPRSRVALESTGFGAVYMDITNDTDTDDELVAASVPDDIAGTVELHETVAAEGGTEDMSDMDMSASEAEDTTDSEEMTGSEAMPGSEDMSEMDMSGMEGMQMREVAGIPVPAGETVTLEPGGLHVMLIDLATDLSEGDEFDVELDFAESGTQSVTVTVSADV